MGTPPGGQPLIYLQIARMLEDDILRGVYREEEQVPSTNELARAFRINPATAAKGINLLAASGVLYKRRGIGMFVAPGAEDAYQEGVTAIVSTNRRAVPWEVARQSARADLCAALEDLFRLYNAFRAAR